MIITASEHNYIMEGMHRLLSEYEYIYSDKALNKIVNEWSKKKAPLIEAFKRHPNYLEGKFMIAFDTNYERPMDDRGARAFWEWLEWNVVHELKNGVPDEIKRKRDEDGCLCLPDELWNFFTNLHLFAVRTISDGTAEMLNRMVPEVRAHKGEKTSRVINRLCKYLGYDKAADYNREFAKFADSLSPMTITRHTVLSINPLDYLTMSFGNSWSSCHTIDKTNKRGMPNSYHGCYSSGTMSYMLDGTSMVFYTVDSAYDGNDYWVEPKINRQMFHYCADKLVQGRLYPQDNDGASNLYTDNRVIVQQIISTIFDFPNLWKLETGTEAAGRYIKTRGTHYRDYKHYSNCTLSVKKDSENTDFIDVGANPICVTCGHRHTTEDNICCCSEVVCAHCGYEVDISDAIEINGRYYCSDCVTTCPICGENVMEDDMVYVDGEDRSVCPHCIEEHYTRCDDCGEYVYSDDATHIEDKDIYVCENCADEHYFFCEECERYFSTDARYPYGGEDLCEHCYEERISQEDAS